MELGGGGGGGFWGLPTINEPEKGTTVTKGVRKETLEVRNFRGQGFLLYSSQGVEGSVLHCQEFFEAWIFKAGIFGRVSF